MQDTTVGYVLPPRIQKQGQQEDDTQTHAHHRGTEAAIWHTAWVLVTNHWQISSNTALKQPGLRVATCNTAQLKNACPTNFPGTACMRHNLKATPSNLQPASCCRVLKASPQQDHPTASSWPNGGETRTARFCGPAHAKSACHVRLRHTVTGCSHRLLAKQWLDHCFPANLTNPST